MTDTPARSEQLTNSGACSGRPQFALTPTKVLRCEAVVAALLLALIVGGCAERKRPTVHWQTASVVHPRVPQPRATTGDSAGHTAARGAGTEQTADTLCGATVERGRVQHRAGGDQRQPGSGRARDRSGTREDAQCRTDGYGLENQRVYGGCARGGGNWGLDQCANPGAEGAATVGRAGEVAATMTTVAKRRGRDTNEGF